MTLRHDMNHELISVFDGENETVKIYYAHTDCCFFLKTPAMPMVYHCQKQCSAYWRLKLQFCINLEAINDEQIS